VVWGVWGVWGCGGCPYVRHSTDCTLDTYDFILNQYHQKSLGVPNQVRGVNPAATITIQTQIEKLTPTEAKSD
jgi:hypothetical protein